MFSVMEKTFDVNAFEKVQITRGIELRKSREYICVALIFFIHSFQHSIDVTNFKIRNKSV